MYKLAYRPLFARESGRKLFVKESERKTVRKNFLFSRTAVEKLKEVSTLLGVSETAIIEILVTEGSAGLQRRIEQRRSAIDELLHGRKRGKK